MRMIRRTAAVLAAAALFSGCQPLVRDDGADDGAAYAAADAAPAGPSLVTATTLRFQDLPVPGSFDYQADRSFIFENADLRAGQMVYEGDATQAQLAAYYREEMARFDWRLVSSLERDFVRLSFEKPSATSEVLIEPAGRLTRRVRATLIYVPRRAGVSSGAGSR